MGPGVFALDAAERGFRFVGIDISEEMIERARGLGIADATYLQGDLAALDGFRDQADAVLAIGLIDYLDDPADGLRRLAACVKPGGVLIVSFRNQISTNTGLRTAAKHVWRRLPGGSRWRPKSAFVSAVHEHSFRPAELRRVLAGFGLAEFEVRYHNVTPGLFVNLSLPRSLWRFWRRADRLLARPLTSCICDAGVIRARRAP
jgi:2-polyprenyl-3-methyl-5-hydroxy-6-metoxy-1,4-benzoquinol methylase